MRKASLFSFSGELDRPLATYITNKARFFSDRKKRIHVCRDAQSELRAASLRIRALPSLIYSSRGEEGAASKTLMSMSWA
nr:hypothetical protein Itr_chr09CG04230 [Ipomoea trifida]